MTLARLAPVVVVLAACAGGGGTMSVSGLLIELEGDLVGVEWFTVVTDDGERLTFYPEAGLTFHGGPLAHLSDHLRSGAPLRVEYREEGDRLVATAVDDR